jgi:hypothetical protein
MALDDFFDWQNLLVGPDLNFFVFLLLPCGVQQPAASPMHAPNIGHLRDAHLSCIPLVHGTLELHGNLCAHRLRLRRLE